MTFPLAILEYKMGIIQTVLWTNTGGLAGIFLFGFLSDQLIFFWDKKLLPWLNYRLLKRKIPLRKRKTFSRRNRRIVRIKTRYGLPGIAFITPLLLSIPVGVFLTERFFGKKKLRFSWLVLSNFVWSFIYAGFYRFGYEAYLNFI